MYPNRNHVVVNKQYPTAQKLYLSSTILRKESRSETKEEDFEHYYNYSGLFRTRMPLLRRQDFCDEQNFY
jgi:hypothetical protein